MAEKVVNPVDDLTHQEIYGSIVSQGYIEKVHKDMMTQLKNTVCVFCFLTYYVVFCA